MSEDQYRMESLIEENQKLRTEHRKFEALQSENDKLKELCERMASAMYWHLDSKEKKCILTALEAYEAFKKGKK